MRTVKENLSSPAFVPRNANESALKGETCLGSRLRA